MIIVGIFIWEGKMDRISQHTAPVYEAMLELRKRRVVPFDVPGHKRGRGNPELVDFLGEKCVGVDVNSMKMLDNLSHPVSVIKEAEELTADAFGAQKAFFMVHGTTSAVQAMVLATVRAGEEILLPRNVHKSVINALVLCGGIPVYVPVRVNHQIGIATGMALSDVERAIREHPKAKAIFVNNPTYYGIASDLKGIVDIAHKAGMKLTQSSIMLCGKGVDAEYVQQIINLTQTTSASYLLISSLDLSRRNLALHGKESFEKVSSMAEYARAEINEIGGFYAYGRELIDGDSVFDFDVTKLSVFTQGIGMTGIEVYDMLRDEYDIQIEFGDIGNILAYISIGDRIRDIERLVGALEDIADRAGKDKKELYCGEFIAPELVMSPREAFYAQGEKLPLEKTVGRVAGEMLMCYPPGIPILTPGERITQEILDYIEYAREKGCSLQGTQDLECREMRILTEI